MRPERDNKRHFEKTPTQVFSDEIFENFKNTHFEEHLRTTVPERHKSIACIRKIVVLGKPVNDTIEQQYEQ